MPSSTEPAARIHIDTHRADGAAPGLAEDVLDGLSRPFKELPARYLYEGRGSELFERICELPEYYPARAERAILAARGDEIVARARPTELVELGSGTASKTRLLLDAMVHAGSLTRYVALDVAEPTLRSSALALAADYPGLRVHGIAGDFELHLDRVPDGGPRLIAFLGGTIGNLLPGSRRRFLRRLSGLLSPLDRLLLGVDLVKDPATIEAAYNDAAGITAAFNRNVLHVVNNELGGNFRPETFEHVAFFDRGHQWVEMRLRSPHACTVRLERLDLELDLGAGEELRTEISAKFTPSRLAAELAASGLALDRWYTDPEGLFGLALARPDAGRSGDGIEAPRD